MSLHRFYYGELTNATVSGATPKVLFDLTAASTVSILVTRVSVGFLTSISTSVMADTADKHLQFAFIQYSGAYTAATGGTSRNSGIEPYFDGDGAPNSTLFWDRTAAPTGGTQSVHGRYGLNIVATPWQWPLLPEEQIVVGPGNTLNFVVDAPNNVEFNAQMALELHFAELGE